MSVNPSPSRQWWGRGVLCSFSLHPAQHTSISSQLHPPAVPGGLQHQAGATIIPAPKSQATGKAVQGQKAVRGQLGTQASGCPPWGTQTAPPGAQGTAENRCQTREQAIALCGRSHRALGPRRSQTAALRTAPTSTQDSPAAPAPRGAQPHLSCWVMSSSSLR